MIRLMDYPNVKTLNEIRPFLSMLFVMVVGITVFFWIFLIGGQIAYAQPVETVRSSQVIASRIEKGTFSTTYIPKTVQIGFYAAQPEISSSSYPSGGEIKLSTTVYPDNDSDPLTITVCGDGFCDPPSENSQWCAQDCPPAPECGELTGDGIVNKADLDLLSAYMFGDLPNCCAEGSDACTETEPPNTICPPPEDPERANVNNSGSGGNEYGINISDLVDLSIYVAEGGQELNCEFNNWGEPE